METTTQTQHKTRNMPLLIGLLIVAGIAVLLAALGPKPEAPVVEDTSEVEMVRGVVEGFGSRMQQVSLPLHDNFDQSMEEAYGEYVTPELIAEWKADPMNAPGRLTSSPWPKDIDIVSAEKQTDNSYVVEGNVREVANGLSGEEVVAVYPATLTLENRGGTWLITDFERGPYGTMSTRKTITGTYVCLPHRDTSGPQTMECAFGIKEDGTGDHYALNLSVLETTELFALPTGSKIRVEGLMTPVEMLSTEQWRKYDIKGILTAASASVLND